MSSRWFVQKERGSPVLIRLILWIALHIGRPTARLLLYPISGYFFLTATEQRKASRRYLERVLEREPHIGDILRHIHCFAATILDRVYLLSDRHQGYNIELKHLRTLMDLVDGRQGCLLVGAHIGSFEVLRALAIKDHPFSLKVLMYPEHNRTVTGLLSSLNPELAETVIPLGQVDSMLEVHNSLSKGAVVGMLGDRAAQNDRTVVCEILDGRARLPIGPALLTASMQVPAILFLGLYHGNKRYEILFERLPDIVLTNHADRQQQMQQWMQHYAERLEYHVRRSPYNWFNFYDFWEEF